MICIYIKSSSYMFILSIINIIYKYIVYIKNNLIEYKNIKLKRYYLFIKKI